MALTEIERELNNLRRLLRDAREWNWIDYNESSDEERDTCPDLKTLDAEISAALSGTGFQIPRCVEGI